MSNFMNSIFGRRNNRRRNNNNNRNNNNGFDVNNLFNGVESMVGNMFPTQQQQQNQQGDNPNQGPPPTAKHVLRRLKETCLNLDDINNGNKNCSICFEAQHVGDLALKLPCGHCFHKNCVYPWLKKHNTCPVCRYELVSEGNNNQDAMSRKEKSDRQRLQAQRDAKKREHENELRRKRERLANLEQNEKKMKKEKANEYDIGKKCSTNYDDNNNSNNNDNILDSENPFDVYDDEDIINNNNNNYNDNTSNNNNNNNGNSFDMYNDDDIEMSYSTTATTNNNNDDDNKIASSDYSNNQYNGRQDDPVWAIVTSLSIKQLKNIIKAIGLDSSTCIDKRDLIEVLSNACYQPYLMKLSVKELKRRLKCMKFSANDLFDKELIVQRIKDGVFDIISMQSFE